MSKPSKFIKALSRGFTILGARPSLQPLYRILFRIVLKGMGIRNFDVEGRITGERHFLRTLAASVQPDAVVFDVGANAGDYVDDIRGEMPSAQVHAFEPNPISYSKLCQRIGLNRGIFANNAGLSDVAGSAILYDDADAVGSRVSTLYVGAAKANKVAREIQLTTLDDYARFRRIDRIDLLKIDVEGHELQVLRGAHAYLAEGRIDVLQFEFNRMNVHSHVFLNDFRALLPGFVLLRLLPSGATVLDGREPIFEEIFDYQNIVAVRAGHPLLTRLI